MKANKSKIFHNNIFTILRNCSKELILAIILAILAAFLVEVYNVWNNINSLHNAANAVATIYTFDNNGKPLNLGSGVFISSDGTLITNYHVINGSDISQTEAKLPNGAFYKYKVFKGGNKQSDIAILQFDGSDIPHMNVGNSDKIESGQHVSAIGSPLGYENTISDGIISFVGRPIGGENLIQFTAPISSGNSGGGLVDDECSIANLLNPFNSQCGKVIGIVTQSVSISPTLQKTITAQNINFAIPINNITNSMKNSNNELAENSKDYYYSLAGIADDNNQIDTAILDYKKAIEIDNKFADAYMGLGGEYYEKGNFELELQNYQKAVELDPKNTNNIYYLGTAYEDKEMYDDAIQSYKKVLLLDPNYKDALYSLGILYIIRGDKKDALVIVPQLTKLDNGLGNEITLLIHS